MASLVSHLLLLWPAPPRLPGKEASLLQATLRRLPPTPALPTPPPPPRAVTPAPTIAPRPPILAAKPFDSPSPIPVPQAPAAAVEPPKPPPALAALPAPAVVAATPAAASPSGTVLTVATTSGEALEGLHGYRLSVASQARRFKRYPPRAMAAGWAGSTEVRLEVGRDGRPLAATVTGSSGHESLDLAALAMIDAGAQSARLPENLRGKAFAVVLPVVFSVEDE